MRQALTDWLSALGFIDEAEASALLYALATGSSGTGGGQLQSTALPLHASITQVELERRGRKLNVCWPTAPALNAQPVAVLSQRELAWLLVELLLREPITSETRSQSSIAEVLAQLQARWRRDFGRPLLEECADFIRGGLAAEHALDGAHAEALLRQFARRCRKELPAGNVGRVTELVLDILDVPALQGGVRAVLRLLFTRLEGRRYLNCLLRLPRFARWQIYLRTTLYMALLVLLANIPGCLRDLDLSVRHSWFVWREPLKPPPQVALVLLEDWRSTEYDRARLIDALGNVLSYKPASVGVDIQLFDPYPQLDRRLQIILEEHPEVVLVGQHTPYGLRTPPVEVTGVPFDPLAVAGTRLATDLVHFAPRWEKYGGYDDYQLYYHQGKELRQSLAMLTALTDPQHPAYLDQDIGTARPPRARMCVNYLGSLKDVLGSSSALTEELLVNAGDQSPEGQAMAPMCAEALAGRAVLIGADALDQDRHTTPFDKLSENSAGAPGVLIHFFALSALEDPALRIRQLDHAAWRLCLLALLLSLLGIRFLRWYHPIVLLLVIAGYYFAGVAALCWLKLYLPWQPVVLTMLAAYPLLCLVAASARTHEVNRLCEL